MLNSRTIGKIYIVACIILMAGFTSLIYYGETTSIGKGIISFIH